MVLVPARAGGPNDQSLNRTLFISDNLPVLRGIDSESIDLIATDPPFNKGVKAFEGITAAGENISYKDVWTWSDVQQVQKQQIDAGRTTPSAGRGRTHGWRLVARGTLAMNPPI